MTIRDKPVMRRVIDTIAAHGPMTVDFLSGILDMSRNSAGKQCYHACNAGYLSMTYDATKGRVGVKRAIYARTDKAFDAFYVTPEVERNRKAKWQEEQNKRDREQRALAAAERKRRLGEPFVPFRHQHDEWLFGPIQFSGQASEVPRVVIEQWSAIVEEEAA